MMDVSYLQNSFGQACLLRKLLEVLGIWVMVDGEVGFHGPELVVLERSPHPFGLLRRWVRLLVPVQVVCLVLITTCCSNREQATAQCQLLYKLKGCGVYDHAVSIRQKAVNPVVGDI